jgi:two-component system, chemotaxis family, protein-glutamate methylesterase/glutaminase
MKPDLVAIVAARRGVAALKELLSRLPSTFASPIVCLVESDARLLELLQASSRLKLRWAEPGARLEPGTVYLSPPGASIVLRPDDKLSITPYGVESSSINPVDHFLTSASRHGGALLALVLAGMEGDGVAGCKDVRARGGAVLVLDRATARYWGAAEPLVRAGASDRVLTLTEVADAMRACFPADDIVRCAEIQIEIGALLESALHMSGTSMGMVSRARHDVLGLLVQRGLPLEAIEKLDAIALSADNVYGRAVLSRSRVVVRDMEAASAADGFQESARVIGARAVHVIPLLPADPPPGMLAAFFIKPHAVVPAEAATIDQIGARIAPIIARLP